MLIHAGIKSEAASNLSSNSRTKATKFAFVAPHTPTVDAVVSKLS